MFDGGNVVYLVRNTTGWLPESLKYFNQNIATGFTFHCWKWTCLYQQICVAREMQTGRQMGRDTDQLQCLWFYATITCAVFSVPQPYSFQHLTSTRPQNNASSFPISEMRDSCKPMLHSGIAKSSVGCFQLIFKINALFPWGRNKTNKGRVVST